MTARHSLANGYPQVNTAMHPQTTPPHTHTHARTHEYARTHARTHAHTHTHTHVRTHIHTHTHPHKQTARITDLVAPEDVGLLLPLDVRHGERVARTRARRHDAVAVREVEQLAHGLGRMHVLQAHEMQPARVLRQVLSTRR